MAVIKLPDYSDYTIKWVTLPWEREQAYALRRRVFCEEQQIFTESDLDEIDSQAQLLVALGNISGWHEQVVGTVRIHEPEPGLWYGSRLAVDSRFRRQGQLGATLIKLAVSSAHACGCQQFLATVQPQNENLFRRLHWQTFAEQLIHGRPHKVMEADLSHYPPCHNPASGFVIRGRQRKKFADLAPSLLQLPLAQGAGV